MVHGDSGKEQLVKENEALRRRVTELEATIGKEASRGVGAAIQSRTEPSAPLSGKECDERAATLAAMNARLTKEIEDRKRIEHSLRQSEELYRNLFETPLVGLWRTRISDGKFIRSNWTNARMIGVESPEELVKCYTAAEFYPTEARTELLSLLRRDGQVSDFEVHLTLKDGTEKDISISAKMYAEDGYLEGVIIDVTDRKRAELALRESEDKYRRLVESITDWVWACDLDGTYTFSNESAFALLGYSCDEIAGTSAISLIHGDDKARIENLFKVNIKRKRGWKNAHFRRQHRDGSIRYFESSAQPVFDARQDLIGFSGIDRDITGRKRAEEEKQRLQDQLVRAQKMECVGTLAGGVAHDFNNLLQGIMGYADLLLLDTQEGDTQHHKLEEITRIARRGSDLTRQLLTFGRKAKSELRPVNLNHEVESVQKLLDRSIPKMIQVDVSLAEDLGTILADAAQIEQILMNLSLNSRDAMPDGGRLTIKTENVEIDRSEVGRHPEMETGKYVLLTVSDTGTGMTPDAMDHMFDPFFTTKDVGQGTGLGLAMVYGIVKNHHGHIICTSEPGQGCTFEIYFPAAEHTGDSPGILPELHLVGGTETLLVVDDESFIRDYAKQTLERFGYTVFTAQDGESAIRLLKKEPRAIDLVVLDMIMPGMGGMRCLEALLEVDPHLKVVVASGYASDNGENGVMKAGARRQLDKPYDVRQLLTTVREVLDQN